MSSASNSQMKICQLFTRKVVSNLSLMSNILSLLSEKDKKQSELCAYLNINTSTMANWKTRNTDPPAKYIIPICEFLEITPYYLLTGKEKSSSPELTVDEQTLLKYFNPLPHDTKQQLIGRAELLYEQMQERNTQIEAVPTPPVIMLKHSFYKVSAGTGYQFDDYEGWEEIDVPETPESRQADFCLTITGNSMEPIYYDGDIVLVKEQPSVDLGEIGIFSIEGAGYIKKFGGDRLISLNAAYDDILFADYDPDCIRCNGLVIGRV